MKYRPLALGIDNFEKIINQGYYYVDKSMLIKQLLDRKSEVTLFTGLNNLKIVSIENKTYGVGLFKKTCRVRKG